MVPVPRPTHAQIWEFLSENKHEALEKKQQMHPTRYKTTNSSNANEANTRMRDTE